MKLLSKYKYCECYNKVQRNNTLRKEKERERKREREKEQEEKKQKKKDKMSDHFHENPSNLGST